MIIKTFRFRLIIIYTAAVIFTFFVYVLAVHVKFKSELETMVDANLMKTAKAAVQNKIGPKSVAGNEEIIKRLGDSYYRMIVSGGELIITSISEGQQWPLNKALMLKAFSGAPQYETAKFMGDNYRTLYFPLGEDNILRIREPLDDVGKEIAGLDRLFLIFFPFILIISAVLSRFLAGKLLEPVISITSLAEKIRHGKLKERINIGSMGKEIDELVTIFNEMLESIERSIEAQKRFTSDVSHEIRSPLTSLRGSIEVALRKKRTPVEYEEILRDNLADISRLSRITDNLLFLTKADNNILELRKQWFDVKHLLETVVERFIYKATSAGLTIACDYQENIELFGDIELLEQVFSNLVDNAIKYSPAGGKITVAGKKEDSFVAVTISDTGIGIPEEDIPHIFERFYRVDKARSKKSGGTGLGLAITQWIINAHNGKITVRSEIGRGSDFVLLFPIKTD